MAKIPAAKKKSAARVAPMQAADARDITAKKFISKLKTLQSDDELRKIQRYFKSGEGQYAHGDTFIGVRMGNVFALAKAFIDMSPAEIEKLMESGIHEARAGAMSIMGQQGMRKKTTDTRRKEAALQTRHVSEHVGAPHRALRLPLVHHEAQGDNGYRSHLRTPDR